MEITGNRGDVLPSMAISRLKRTWHAPAVLAGRVEARSRLPSMTSLEAGRRIVRRKVRRVCRVKAGKAIS